MTRVSEYYFEQLGDDFAKFMSEYDVARRIALLETLIPRHRRFERALEVGCGTGAISRMLQTRVDSLMVCDLSDKLARAVGQQLGCSWAVQDASAMSFADEGFDLVVSSEVIEHTPEPWCAVAEMARVLRPGGVLVLTTPNKLWYPVLVVAQKARLRKFAGNEVWLWPREMEKWLRQHDFAQIVTSGCHLFPWQLPGAKRVLPWFDSWGQRLYRVMINFGVSALKR